MYTIGSEAVKDGTKEKEIRRVQALTGDRSFTLVLPKAFAIELGIGKGDFLKCHVEGNKLVVQKMEVV
jgi:bifunctional DNA-binding transcriptional regulator/antitoxin component of YhaV-PrlF toxin-antitoxin module